jgi:hypothetical protein
LVWICHSRFSLEIFNVCGGSILWIGIIHFWSSESDPLGINGPVHELINNLAFVDRFRLTYIK